jgi:hypothetical protein
MMNAALGLVCTDGLYLGREQPGLMRQIFRMKHTPDTGLIARPGGLQPNVVIGMRVKMEARCQWNEGDNEKLEVSAMRVTMGT